MECSLTETSFGDHGAADDEFNEGNILGCGRLGGGRKKRIKGLGSPKMLQPPSFDQVLMTLYNFLLLYILLFTIYMCRRTLNQESGGGWFYHFFNCQCGLGELG